MVSIKNILYVFLFFEILLIQAIQDSNKGLPVAGEYNTQQGKYSAGGSFKIGSKQSKTPEEKELRKKQKEQEERAFWERVRNKYKNDK